jgi:Major Facilitator Superfamily
VAFVAWERRSRSPMLPLAMFRARNFAVGNLATLLFYGSLNTLSFFLVVFLQQVAGYSPLHAGLALLPMSLITFALARRFGALADRIGPRIFMGVGPIVAGVGVLLLARAGARAGYFTELLPGITLFSLGLAATVAPLTAAVLGAVGSGHSGVASGINNAIARVAGLVAIAAVGAVVAAHFAAGVQSRLGNGRAALAAAPLREVSQRPFVIDASAFAVSERPAVRAALVSSSLGSYRLAMEISGALAILSGLLSLGGISNRRRTIAAADCAGGALVGASAALQPAAHAAPSAAGV